MTSFGGIKKERKSKCRHISIYGGSVTTLIPPVLKLFKNNYK